MSKKFNNKKEKFSFFFNIELHKFEQVQFQTKYVKKLYIKNLFKLSSRMFMVCLSIFLQN